MMKIFINLTTAVSIMLSGLFIPLTTTEAKVASPNDLPLIQFAEAGYTVNEETNTVEAIITLSESSPITVTVNVTSTGITAAIGNDFIPVFSQFTLSPGQTTIQVTVDIMDDWQVEAEETFLLAVSDPVGAILGPQTTTIVTILDNDGFVDTGIQLSGKPSSWADYDSDGDLDLLTNSVLLYQNNGLGIFTQAVTSLPTTTLGFSDWADYDNDGDVDVLLYSSTDHTLQIYRNDGGGSFVSSGVTFPSRNYNRTDWGDFDNDGDIDLLIIGDTGGTGPSFTKIYRNEGSNIFVDVGLTLEAIGYGDCAWADFDNDGDLDFALTGNRIIGSTLTNGVTFVYRNNGNSTFTKLSTSFTGLSGGSIGWGDYDKDGDLDFLVDGCSASYYPCPYLTKLYKNNNGAFADAGAGLPGAGASADLAWGDYDNDGDLDILLTGIDNLNPNARVYRNDGGIFTDIVTGLSGTLDSHAGWADYDNDGDLDIVTGTSGGMTKIYQNKIHQPNTKPGTPTGLSANVGESEVTLNWLAPTDAETLSGSLSYSIWVGNYPGGSNVASPMSNGQTGDRQVPEMGTVQLGTSAKLINLQPNRDYYWRVQAIDSAFAGSPFSAQGTFRTLPAAVRFTQGSQSVAESNSTVPIGISLSTVAYQTITVDYFTESVSAQPGYDFQPISGTVTFNPGQTQATIMLPVYDDNFKELNETFRLKLSNPNNAVLGTPSSNLITITDNDSSYGVCFSQPEYSASEIQPSLNITTTLCGVSATVPITVSLNTVGGTATQGVDYQPVAQTIVFLPGQTYQIVNTLLINDPVHEEDETILYQLSNPIHAVIGNPGSATGIIQNDDNIINHVSFEVSDIVAQEADGYLPVTVTLAVAEAYEIQVHVNDLSQTGLAGQDYEAVNQTVIFPPGETQQIISVALNDDALDENDETFLLQLSNPVNVQLGTLTETLITLIDNDPIPSIQFVEDATWLGESQGYTAITVTLSAPSEKVIYIHYTTTPGTAGLNDFIQASGILTFSPGVTSQAIYLSPIQDSTDEDNETFTLNLTSPVNASLGTPSTLLVTINDDDASPSIHFSQPAYQAGEAQDSASVLIAISNASELPIAVNFEITGGTASLIEDYSVEGGPIILINPGEVTATVWFHLVDDLLTEGDETIQFSLSNPINSVLGNPTTATFTIIDNDMPPIAVDDIYTGTEEVSLSVDVQVGLLANDHDPDSTNLVADLISEPSHGMLTLHLDGSFTYTPTLNYSGIDTFVYSVSDGLSEVPGTVSLTIAPVNDSPDAINDTGGTAENTPVVLHVLTNDSDIDGDALTISHVNNPLNGEVVYSNGVITYTPHLQFIGVDTFNYTLSDGELTDTATVVVIVSAGIAPSAVGDTYSAFEGTPLVVPVETGLLANDLDPRGLGLTAHLISNPLNGTLWLNEDGSFTYIPNPGFKGNDLFTYRVYDGVGYSLVVEVVITVNMQDSAYSVYLPTVRR